MPDSGPPDPNPSAPPPWADELLNGVVNPTDPAGPGVDPDISSQING
ncbi:MAG: hypothetical protein KGP08_09250 [Xanthomonadaceae bacterium]|nr:hypothetical protein [Xanthomonadaceae bacterium]